jgi:hypothetical protein
VQFVYAIWYGVPQIDWICWRYTIGKKVTLNKHDLNNYNLHNYFSLILPTNEVELLKTSLGYIAEMYDMNAYNGLLTLRKDFDIKNNDFYVLRDGISILSDSLCKYIENAKVKLQHLEALAYSEQQASTGANQLDLFSDNSFHPAVELLEELQPDELSPKQALDLIYKLKYLLARFVIINLILR